MQGFNRYIPADYDPKKNSTLNSHQGKKHALGNRAKDIDKGVLVVRFELPYNIWCGTCNNHIGAGVRYNAQKKKVGNYYSTPIYGFRCKCHLCQHWFEIRTDPKNAAYVVHEGARKQESDWDPAENGGFAAQDTDTPSASEPPADAFAATEKTIDQQTWAKKNSSRLSELSELSDRQSADPYAASMNLRRKFRAEKREALEKQGRDDGLRERYGLAEDVDLGEEDVEGAKARWEAGRERAGLPFGADGEGTGVGGEAGDSVRAISGTPALSTPGRGGGGGGGSRWGVGPNMDLAQVLRKTTKRRYDPFADAADALLDARGGVAGGMVASSMGGMKMKGRIRDAEGIGATPAKVHIVDKGKATPVLVTTPVAASVPALGGLLSGYESD